MVRGVEGAIEVVGARTTVWLMIPGESELEVVSWARPQNALYTETAEKISLVFPLHRVLLLRQLVNTVFTAEKLSSRHKHGLVSQPTPSHGAVGVG